MRQKRYVSCYYGLRENPKKKTQKSFGLESMKKILFRCGECGKGFRYEKCLSNHQAGMHSPTNQRGHDESIKSLCSSFSSVRKKKRSRVMRYNRTPLSCSFTRFLESRSVLAENDEELEVAEYLILLSRSSPKFVVDGLKLVGEAMNEGCLNSKKPRKAFESGCFSNEKKLMEEPASFLGRAGEFESDEKKLTEEGISTNESLKEPASFLGEKKQRKSGESDSDTESNRKKNVEHQCRLCSKIFSSYQALGGHQTFHRLSKSKKKKNCRAGSVEPEEDESVKKTYKA